MFGLILQHISSFVDYTIGCKYFYTDSAQFKNANQIPHVPIFLHRLGQLGSGNTFSPVLFIGKVILMSVLQKKKYIYTLLYVF